MSEKTTKVRKSKYDSFLQQAESLQPGQSADVPLGDVKAGYLAFALRIFFKRKGISNIKVSSKNGAVKITKS